MTSSAMFSSPQDVARRFDEKDYLLDTGIASAIYLAYFMKMLGHYKWAIVAPVALGVPSLLFVVFEIWFLVPLPKGPVESYFGF